LARLGIFGGTFNPPHVGHLICAQEAWSQLELDRVVFMPVSSPPHKELIADPGPSVRVELCRRAVAGDERFEVSTAEVDRGGASFTVDTLRELHARRPEDQLTFIAGGDMARSLPGWRSPEEIVALAEIGVAERDGVGREDIRASLRDLAAGERVRFFDMPRLAVSSSMVRARVADGRPIRYYVPGGVAELIESEGLYRREAVAAR
jgi:nicotinate-nucleotide adenylyltransferase